MSDYSSDPQGTFEQARNGDKQAFISLLEYYKERLQLHIRRRLRHRETPRFNEDDIYNEICLRGMKIRPKSRPVGEPQSAGNISEARERHFNWLLRFAKHTVIDLWRKNYGTQARNPHRETHLPGFGTGGATASSSHVQFDIPADDSTPSVRARKNERDERLYDAKMSCDPDERQLIEFILAGESFQSIAKQLNIAVDTARKRWERLRKRLRLDDDFEGLTDLV